MDRYYDELFSEIRKGKLTKHKLSALKKKLCLKYRVKEIPTDIEVLLNAPDKDVARLRKLLMTKPTRTLSGVAVIAVMSKRMRCPHGRCIMCPGGVDSVFGPVPQSYTGHEPATLRAIRNNYDAYLQVMNRLEQYIVSGHVPDKIELIIMGGTFPSYPRKYQEEFVGYALKAMNDFSKMFFSGSDIDITKFKAFFELPGDINDKDRLKRVHSRLLRRKGRAVIIKEQDRNDRASRIKCVGLTIETRPDYARLKHANHMLKLGCTRVELGIQTVYDDVLRKINRGHSVKDSADSTRILKDLGFKINYHVMIGLPGVTRDMDRKALAEYFGNADYRPDMIKVYPCMVLKGTRLYNLWKQKKFRPITTYEAAKMIAKFKPFVPEYVRIMRVQRDIATNATEAGVDRTNLRQYVHAVMRENKLRCRCIRCREAGRHEGLAGNIEYEVMSYKASAGKEFFITACMNDSLLGFCRLRIPSRSLRQEITSRASMVRELHVYGEAVPIGTKGRVQHRGIGKRLLSMAENISLRENREKVVVISGIGVRDYYRKLGYRRQGPYMVKKI